MLSDKQRGEIVSKYLQDQTVISLAEEYCISRQGVYKILWQSGVDIKSAGRKKVACACCGHLVSRNRRAICNAVRQFCSRECYYAWIKAQNPCPKYSRNGSRIARKVVAAAFDLQSNHIVHHKDGNQCNNALNNLVVFASQSDHIKHHRGVEVQPIKTFD